MKIKKNSAWATALFLLGAPSLCLAAAPESAQQLTGTVRIAPALKSKISPEAVLYVIARQTVTGPPVAVKRITQPFKFPVHFSVGPEDSMMGGTKLEGQFSLSARISQNGSAMPKPGDLQTKKAAENNAPGGAPVSLLIEETR
jgi:cytochrome c-type biogenesis protein CcmH